MCICIIQSVQTHHVHLYYCIAEMYNHNFQVQNRNTHMVTEYTNFTTKEYIVFLFQAASGKARLEV